MPLQITPEHQRLLETQGHIVVRGGAGSGKTTIALLKAAAELEEGQLGNGAKALFLSFARATIARVAEQATATLSASQRSRLELNTYHGFAWTILKSHAYLVGRRVGVSLLLPGMARTRLVGFEGEQRSERQRALFEEDGLVSFDQFAPLTTQILEACPVLARAYGAAYPLVIVDEFQDTNADEWAMVRQLGAHSHIIALGDPRQRIYDFKGADPRRFDEFVAAFQPVEFDFRAENRRSPGTQIPLFADDLIAGNYTLAAYAGVNISRYPGRSLRPLKQAVLAAANRMRREPDWSLAILTPANALAGSIYDYMRQRAHGLPPYPIDIAVSAEGPALAARFIALMLEPSADAVQRACDALEAMAAFNLGKVEIATAASIQLARNLNALAVSVRANGLEMLHQRVIGRSMRLVLEQIGALGLTGDPVTDWLAVRNILENSERDEIKAIAREARHMRLLRRGAQIESRFAESWRLHGSYKGGRGLLDVALVEDQFAATSRAPRGATVMTIHKAKGKEFDEVMVFESVHRRYIQGEGAEAIRSARYNLHVAATRARRSVTIFTPAVEPSLLLP